MKNLFNRKNAENIKQVTKACALGFVDGFFTVHHLVQQTKADVLVNVEAGLKSAIDGTKTFDWYKEDRRERTSFAQDIVVNGAKDIYGKAMDAIRRGDEVVEPIEVLLAEELI